MKKFLLAVVVVASLAVAGTAMAGPRGWGGCGWGGNGSYGMMDWGRGGGGYGMMGWGHGGWGHHGYGRDGRSAWQGEANVPQEIQNKRAEAQKVAIDLRTELSKNPVNRAKVLDLYKKEQALRQSIADWNFQQRLNATQ